MTGVSAVLLILVIYSLLLAIASVHEIHKLQTELGRVELLVHGLLSMPNKG